MKLFSQYRGLRRENYVLFFGRVVTSLGAMVWPMLTMILTRKLGMSASGAALFSVVTGALYLPATVVGGKLADRCEKKKIIVICDAFSVALFLLCACLPMGVFTVAVLAVGGLFQGLEGPAYSALIADLNPTADRDRAYSLGYLGANLGMILSPTIAGFLFQNYLWLAFLISGVSIGISTALIFFFVRDVAPREETGEEAEYQKEERGLGLFAVLKRNKTVLLYLFVMAFYFAAYSQFGFLMPLDLGRIHGENGALLYGSISSINCIVVVLFTPLITRLTARLSGPQKTVAGILQLLLGYLLFLLGLGIIPLYYLSMTLFTWGEIFTTIADGPYLTARVPATHRGRIVGFGTVLTQIFEGAARLSLGTLYDECGNVAAWIAVFSLLAASLFLGLILLRRDRRIYPKLYAKKRPEEHT
ncbi:MAG: MFS transporter [Clostridia bacterium]|nr:MFS transporter [Clostridia bacterium]